MSQKNLNKTTSFSALFFTQFMGALNDNFFKNTFILLLTFDLLKISAFEKSTLVTLAGAVFILPFILFSSLAGQIGDLYPKPKIARFVKIFEIFIMIFASISFYIENPIFLFIALFLMGCHSTLFGPIKYSLIPELLPKNKLVKGNALIEAGTFLAILLGTVGSGIVIHLLLNEENSKRAALISFFLLFFAIAGFLSSLQIKTTPNKLPHQTERKKIHFNLFKENLKIFKQIKKNKILTASLFGISQFWFLGAGILSMLPLITFERLHSDPGVVTLFLALFTLGIGMGSISCEKGSKEKVERAYIPLGSLFISIFCFGIFLSLLNYPIIDGELLSLKNFLLNPTLRIHSVLLLFSFSGLSIASGFYTVPLYTLLQTESEEKDRSKIISFNNFCNALFMVICSLLLMLLYKVGFSFAEIFLLFSVLQFFTSLYFYNLAPDFFWRFVCQFLTKILFRVEVRGENFIPEKGPLIILCNHISYIDWLIIQSAVNHPIRFLMYYTFFKVPVFNKICRDSHIIPIAENKEDFRIIMNSFKIISKELKNNQIVCLFPEGGISYTGEIDTFKRGLELIIEKNTAPLLPVHLKGLYGGLFSRSPGTFKEKLKRTFFIKITITFGEEIIPPTEKEEIKGYREKCRELYFNRLSLKK